MRRGLVHAAAWAAVTGAAAALSWCGVRTVLNSTATDLPRAVPLTGTGRVTTRTESSSTHRPLPPHHSPSGSPSPSAVPHPGRTRPTHRPSHASDPPDPSPTDGTGTPESDTNGTVRGYSTRGGQVVFDLHPTSAELVSATPDTGWQMQVWKEPGLIRVDFVSGADTTSVFCSWNNGPPTVQIDEH